MPRLPISFLRRGGGWGGKWSTNPRVSGLSATARPPISATCSGERVRLWSTARDATTGKSNYLENCSISVLKVYSTKHTDLYVTGAFSELSRGFLTSHFVLHFHPSTVAAIQVREKGKEREGTWRSEKHRLKVTTKGENPNHRS